MIHILVLANDFADSKKDIGPGTRARCRKAAERCAELANLGIEAHIILAAGRDERMPTSFLMSARMESFLNKLLSPVSFTVNHTDEEVWGIMKEMKWAFKRVRPEDEVEVVISRQASWRVKFISLVFFNRSVRVLCSQERTPWWHEALGYTKIAAYAFGFGEIAEKWRRRYYREW